MKRPIEIDWPRTVLTGDGRIICLDCAERRKPIEEKTHGQTYKT